MYRVVISPSANADLFNALKYIAYELENQQAAAKLADGIEKCYTDLEDFPGAHELCRDPVPPPQTPQILFVPFVIFVAYPTTH